MSRFIVNATHSKTGKSYWLEWSTVIDAPVSICEGLAEFVAYYLREYGVSGERRLCERLGRVAVSGTSSQRPGDSANDFLAYNRAGPDETQLSSWDEIIDYCLTAGEEVK